MSIPKDVLKALCDAYDQYVGEYPDPMYVGRDFFDFYEEGIKKLEEEKRETELIDGLAALEHKQWMWWTRALIASGEKISKTRTARWTRLWCPYNELPESQKEMDRIWARKVLKIVEKAMKR